MKVVETIGICINIAVYKTHMASMQPAYDAAESLGNYGILSAPSVTAPTDLS